MEGKELKKSREVGLAAEVLIGDWRPADCLGSELSKATENHEVSLLCWNPDLLLLGI